MNIDPKLTSIKDCLYRVAAKAVIIKNDKVLLTKDSEDIGWTFPGGGIDIGENVDQAIIRELSEEIGISADDVVVLPTKLPVSIGHVKDGIPRCNIHVAVSLNTDEISPTQEIVELQWIPVNELQQNTFDTSAGDKDIFIDIVTKAKIAVQ